ncbi:MAG: UDP-N-acetylmuramate--L-alanine ligase, partial [Kiritimatiellae bacterium]|nr:UDP-N-acetylmuramate--L-alanine ligase [Kiritimatiellia bacterium]
MNGAKKIHFVGIGGVGMAALAVLLKNRGWDVSGCDVAAGARTRWLEGLGVGFSCGHDVAHLSDGCEVVVTPAVSRDNPERAAASGRVRMRGEVLADVVNAAPDSIAVCGSHGKTTTATFTARLLLALGE